MLDITLCHDAAALVAYYAADLADESGSRPNLARGRWLGKGAELLGMRGAVTKSQFRRLARNTDPGTGQRLTQRRAPNRRIAFDVTISAPKSVSIMAEVIGDTRVSSAHDEAVADTMAEVENLAHTRIRQAGANTDCVTGNLIAAVFRHETSRANDPQLHSHVIVLNATFDEIERRWKALQPGEIYRRSRLLTEIYRTSLRSKLHRIGYATKRTTTGFEIAGVSEDIIRRFSKRRAEIDGIEEQLGSSGNPLLRKAIARRSREPKADARNAEQLRIHWAFQLTDDQIAELKVLKCSAKAPVNVRPISPADALKSAALHVFERRSVVPVDQLFTEALVIGGGTLAPKEA